MFHIVSFFVSLLEMVMWHLLVKTLLLHPWAFPPPCCHQFCKTLCWCCCQTTPKTGFKIKFMCVYCSDNVLPEMPFVIRSFFLPRMENGRKCVYCKCWNSKSRFEMVSNRRSNYWAVGIIHTCRVNWDPVRWDSPRVKQWLPWTRAQECTSQWFISRTQFAKAGPPHPVCWLQRGHL